jgi:hypothetical protein
VKGRATLRIKRQSASGDVTQGNAKKSSVWCGTIVKSRYVEMQRKESPIYDEKNTLEKIIDKITFQKKKMTSKIRVKAP